MPIATPLNALSAHWTPRPWTRGLMAALMLVALVFAAAPDRVAHGQLAITVTIADGDSTDPGSLIDAILNIDNNGTITFASGLSLITVTSNIVINDANTSGGTTAFTIDGPGVGDLTISRVTASNGPIFSFLDDIDVTISNLTLSGGGGSIAATNGSGTLVLDSVLVTGATKGPGINTGQSVSVTIRNSTISGNTNASAGGGINIGNTDGSVLIENSTISGNTAGLRGGGIFDGRGGQFSSLTIRNSTITTNTSTLDGGGISTNNPDVVDGGFNVLFDIPALVLDSTIVAGNFAGGTGPDVFVDMGGTDGGVTATFSLIGDPTGHPLVDAPNNIVDDDAELVALAANGGPTETHALMGTSPALNMGDANGLTADQRGFEPRAFGAAADIGAYESGATAPVAPATVTVTKVVGGTDNPNEDDTFTVTIDGNDQTPIVLDSDGLILAGAADSATEIVAGDVELEISEAIVNTVTGGATRGRWTAAGPPWRTERGRRRIRG